MRLETRIKTAVVGGGYWGPNLMRNFSENAGSSLGWIVDLNAAMLAKFGHRFPLAKLTTNLAEALADPELRAVAIATPVSTHFDIARQCLDAGKSVIVEKPLAGSAAQCDELIALAESKGLALMVDHTFIYTGAVRKMKEIIDAGELGEIYYFDSVRVNLGLFQHDVNVIWDLAPHDLSIMDFLLTKKPVKVAAHGACHIAGSSIENIAYLTLRFPDDTIAHFHVNWLAPAKIRRIIIGGSKKMLVFDDLNPDEKIKIYDKGLVMKSGGTLNENEVLAGYRIGDLYVPNIDGTEALKRVADHFIECIATGRKPVSGGDAGRRVVRILEAAQESLAHDGAMIAL
jgi:predicted dehydrogenase